MTPDLPEHAIDYCLREAGIGRGDLDFVAFCDKPLLKFDRLLETYLAYSPAGFELFLMGLPLWLNRLLLERQQEVVDRADRDFNLAARIPGAARWHAAAPFIYTLF